MKPINLHSKEVIIFCLLFVLVSCKKEKLIPTGLWKLNSVLLNDKDKSEQFNTFFVSSSVSFLTSCNSQLLFHDSSALYFATLDLSNSFIYESRYKHKHIDYDSTYNSCSPQYYMDSISNTLKGTCEKDQEHISITYVYHYSPGGGTLYTTRTYNVIESTKKTLIISGHNFIGPYFSYDTLTFTFSR